MKFSRSNASWTISDSHAFQIRMPRQQRACDTATHACCRASVVFEQVNARSSRVHDSVLPIDFVLTA